MSTSESDLCRLLDALDGDGVIVAPCPVGYLAATSSAAGVDRIFELKGRDRSRSLSVGGHALHEGRRYLQELAGIGGAELLELSATMGLIGTRRHD
ncbi:Sua5/YciO/YrdC/YwlC family protein, partial [Planctomycetota bacterium]|nr:Sua5/YciO/YrdC/YwlC family protein [Planctomycetota bacterium]